MTHAEKVDKFKHFKLKIKGIPMLIDHFGTNESAKNWIGFHGLILEKIMVDELKTAVFRNSNKLDIKV